MAYYLDKSKIGTKAIIQYDRGKNNMSFCEVGDVFLYSETYDGENDPIHDVYINQRTNASLSSTILFETGWAKIIEKQYCKAKSKSNRPDESYKDCTCHNFCKYDNIQFDTDLA